MEAVGLPDLDPLLENSESVSGSSGSEARPLQVLSTTAIIVMESSTDEVDGSTPLASLTCENASGMTLQNSIPKSQLIDCIKSYQKDLGPILEEAKLSIWLLKCRLLVAHIAATTS